MVKSEKIHPEPRSLLSNETAGTILSSARVGWDLSVEEVAENLNLKVDTIKALERDDYEALPGYTFVKGYIRSYANLLRLNPDEVIAMVDLQPEKMTEIPSVRGSIKIKRKSFSRKKKKKSGIFFKFILLLILLIVLGVVGLNQWSKLDTKALAELFKLPISETSEDDTEGDTDSVILFPSSDTPTQQNTPEKGALIRIE
jgi:cytoskeletal protein RodZ